MLNSVGTTGNSSFVTVGPITTDSLRIWGVGIVQNIDAAAMELYLGYRNYKADAADAAGNASTLNSIDVIAAGARIKF